jgi:preprotein translocase subunit SecE
VARDRKRAKQRRVRRADRPARANPAPAGGVEAPSPLEHASAGIEEFDAALVRGAGGAPAPEAAEAAGVAEPEALLSEGATARVQSAEELGVGVDDGGASGGGFDDGDRDRGGGGGEGEGARERQPGAPLPSGNRALAFMRASWAELQRVQWPDRRQVTQATAVVLGFVAVAGAYLGLADVVAKEIVEFIL